VLAPGSQDTLVLSVDTISSLQKLEALYQDLPPMDPRRARVKFAIRLNSNHVLGHAIPSRFGVPPNVERLRTFLDRDVVPFAGFHSHHGSESNSPQAYFNIARRMASLVKALHLDPAKLWLNMGGGMHGIVPDSKSFQVNDVDTLMHSVSGLVAGIKAELPAGVKLFLEPGRWLSLGSGFGCAKVMTARHDWWADEHDRPWHTYTLDMSSFLQTPWEHPYLPPPADPEEPMHRAVFQGPSCYENDRFGTSHQSRVRREGDAVVLAGLSGYSYALNNDFNGIPRAPVEFFAADGKVIDTEAPWVHKQKDAKYM